MARVRVRQKPIELECRYSEEEKVVYFFIMGRYVEGMALEPFKDLFVTVRKGRDDQHFIIRGKGMQHFYAEDIGGFVKVFRGATGMHFLELYASVFNILFETVSNRFDVNGLEYEIGEAEIGELRVFEYMTDRVLNEISPREALSVFMKGRREKEEKRDFLDMLIRTGDVDFSIKSEPIGSFEKSEVFHIMVRKGTDAIGYKVVGSQHFNTRYLMYRCKNLEEVLELLEPEMRRVGQKLDLESVRF